MAYYWTCPNCGSNLDRNEKCDCKERKERKERKKEFFSKRLRMEPRTGQMSLVFEERKV